MRKIAIWRMRRVFWRFFNSLDGEPNYDLRFKIYDCYQAMLVYCATQLGDKSLNLEEDLDLICKAIK